MRKFGILWNEVVLVGFENPISSIKRFENVINVANEFIFNIIIG